MRPKVQDILCFLKGLVAKTEKRALMVLEHLLKIEDIARFRAQRVNTANPLFRTFLFPFFSYSQE